VKTIRFHERRNLGNPITVARIYNSRNVDELILLDIDASKEGRHIDSVTIQDVASECFMPLTVGGGLKTEADVEEALKRGADKVVINTAALERPETIRELSKSFGSQCIIVSIDITAAAPLQSCKIFSHAKQAVSHHDVIDFCKLTESFGAGEIFANSVDRDGMMIGFDLDLVGKIAQAVKIPIIACGGASKPGDFADCIKKGASAAAGASIFHFTDFTPEDCRRALRDNGIPAR
jgi:cyclase